MRESHPKAIQVSDRFHFLKNLADYCKDYIKRTVRNKIEIQLTEKIAANNIAFKTKYEYDTTWDLITDVKKLRSKDYTIEQISASLGLGNKTIIKYSRIHDSEKEKYSKKSTSTIKSDSIRNNKETLIEEAKELDKKSCSMRKIADKMSLDRRTVKKYIASDGTYTHASAGITRSGKLSKFENCIIEMYSDGAKGTIIINKLRKEGYTGSESLIRHFISKINRKIVSADNTKTEQISRKHLISLLCKEIERVKSISQKQLNMVFELYPDLVAIYKISKN